MGLRTWSVAILNHAPAWMARRLRSDGRLASALRPLLDRVLPREIIEVRVLSGLAQGISILIEPRGEKLYWTGTFEPDVQRVLAEVLHDGDVMWDVGAHVGFHTAIGSRLVGIRGEVVAFEPFQPNVERLTRLVRANGLQNVRIRPVAISDDAGTAVFNVAPSAMMGSLVAVSGATDTIAVPAVTLDEEMTASRPPSLVKVDVEGGEAAVLAGGSRLLSELRPLLLVEFLSPDALDRARRMLPHYEFRRLDEHNYLGAALNARSSEMS